jgi:rubrerythrin
MTARPLGKLDERLPQKPWKPRKRKRTIWRQRAVWPSTALPAAIWTAAGWLLSNIMEPRTQESARVLQAVIGPDNVDLYRRFFHAQYQACRRVRFRWRRALARRRLARMGPLALDADTRFEVLQRIFVRTFVGTMGARLAEQRPEIADADGSTWQCCVCMIKQHRARRLGCSHMLCGVCEKKVDKCPLCRAPKSKVLDVTL